jgi:hypothetical protein
MGERSSSAIRVGQYDGNVGGIMRIWLEYDSVSLAMLVFGIAVIELLALSI